MLPLVSVVKQLVPTGLFSQISSGLRASSGFICLVRAPWNRNSCALAAPSCQPALPADIISACLAMQPGRGAGGAARGESQRYCLCCRALNTRYLLLLEATCQAKLKILNVIGVCFSKTHSQPSVRDFQALSAPDTEICTSVGLQLHPTLM